MGQIIATFVRIIKEFLMDRGMVFWSIFFPIIWLIMANIVFLANAPESEVLPFRGTFTISMIVYAVMIAGMVDLPGNIAADRNRGMLSKLKSMSVSQFKDFLGRILAFLVFSLIHFCSFAITYQHPMRRLIRWVGEVYYWCQLWMNLLLYPKIY